MSKVGWPTFWHLHPGVRKREELSLGERAADRMRNIMGSWPFVFSFFGVMILWAAGNTYFLQRVIHHKAFDPYPYILLNLFLSMLAAIQAPVIMMSQNRQDTKDRVRGELDFDVNRRAETEIQGLSRKLNQLAEKLADIDDHLRGPDEPRRNDEPQG